MKKAILVVSFGTSYKETRKKTIEACEKKIKEDLKDYDFFRAFTSNTIIKIIKNKDNLRIKNPIESLDELYEKDYKKIIVQPLHIVCGEEFNKLKNQVESYKNKFEKIILGRPLLTNINDCKEVANILQIPKMHDKEAILFMGHGTNHKSHTIYKTLENVLINLGINAYVGTFKEHKEIEYIIKRLKSDDIKTVNLMVFMLVAGNHALNDMAGDKNSWKTILENHGFKVNIHLNGLGENPFIQDKFMKHAYECVQKLGD